MAGLPREPQPVSDNELDEIRDRAYNHHDVVVRHDCRRLFDHIDHMTMMAIDNFHAGYRLAKLQKLSETRFEGDNP